MTVSLINAPILIDPLLSFNAIPLIVLDFSAIT